jgi:hypothetical protein
MLCGDNGRRGFSNLVDDIRDGFEDCINVRSIIGWYDVLRRIQVVELAGIFVMVLVWWWVLFN